LNLNRSPTMKIEVPKLPRVKLIDEFKAFALKGNMIDLAVAVIIGVAFGAVVKSLVDHIIMPLLSYVAPGKDGGYTTWHIGRVQIGLFLAEILNFLIVAAAVFIMIVKVLGYLIKLGSKREEPGPVTTKECPFCISTISIRATRCPNCTSELAQTTIASS